MNTIIIGGQQRNLQDATPQWIHEQIDPRNRSGGNPCVLVRIKIDDVDVQLSTPTCHTGGGGGGGGGGGRKPNRKEQAILELWEKLHLNTLTFTAGNVIAFVQQVQHLT